LTPIAGEMSSVIVEGHYGLSNASSTSAATRASHLQHLLGSLGLIDGGGIVPAEVPDAAQLVGDQVELLAKLGLMRRRRDPTSIPRAVRSARANPSGRQC
jgi:hypothetical protein